MRRVAGDSLCHASSQDYVVRGGSRITLTRLLWLPFLLLSLAPLTAQAQCTPTPTTLCVTTTPSPLPSGSVGSPYFATINVSGGTAPYTFSTSGFPGVQESNGTISGTPSQAGSFTFNVTIQDSAAHIVTPQFMVIVPPTITTTSLPNGAVGLQYSQTLSATPDIAPLTWSPGPGPALPAGLTVAGNGVVSGIPTTAGLHPSGLQ